MDIIQLSEQGSPIGAGLLTGLCCYLNFTSLFSEVLAVPGSNPGLPTTQLFCFFPVLQAETLLTFLVFQGLDAL